jgi:hypothetical protein
MGVSQELEKLRLAQIGTEISAEMRAIAQVSFAQVALVLIALFFVIYAKSLLSSRFRAAKS